MRNFIKRAQKKLDKLTPDQVRDIFSSAAGEIERLDTVLDSLSEGIIVLNAEHSLVLANKYARRLLPPNIHDQGKGIFWKDLRDEKTAAFIEKTILSGDRADGWEFTDEYIGNERLFSLSIFPLVKDGSISGSLIRVEDITEKRSREERMRRMENLASLSSVAAGVAHEIKNPLGSISIHVQLIEKLLAGIKHSGKLDKYINVVNEEIDRLNKIVVDFLFAVRPMQLDLRRRDINALIGETAELFSFELEAAKVKTELELEEKIPLIDFDSGFMKQVLINLIKNAIHAMPDGGTLTIGTAIRDNSVFITVKDTGEGIPDENFPKIFEPYFTTRETGTGLGLTLVFKIVREHQGEINVKSSPGKGSVFTISLPLPQTERILIGAPE